MTTSEGRRLTRPQRSMLELLLDGAKEPRDLACEIPTNNTGLSIIANHLYPLIAWADAPEVFYVPRERRAEAERLLDGDSREVGDT